jgi:dipeptidyl aminopeptidase/acylaminoacyl peptidase
MRRLFTCLLFILSGCAAAAIPSIGDASAVDAAKPFTINDYFKLQKVTELAISSDGEMMVYAVTQQSLAENRAIRTVFISSTVPGAKVEKIDGIQDGRAFAWMPGQHELAYLSSDGKDTHLYSVNIKTKSIRQHTHGTDSVVQFRFSPDGKALAWLTQATLTKNQSSLYDRLFNGDKGVVIDSENTVVYQFVNPEWPDVAARSSNRLWLKHPGADAFSVDAPGSVKNFYWSTDASKLSISYVANNMPEEAFFDTYTSLGVFYLTTRLFRTLGCARPPAEAEEAVYYTGGEWVPGEDKLFVRRTKERTRWVSNSEWALINVRSDELTNNSNRKWHEIEIYHADFEPVFLPANEKTVFYNKTIHARQSLYQITSLGIERADILQDVQGSISLVRFSTDFKTAIFVNESLVHPPEIYIWRKGLGLEKLSQLNEEIAEKLLPRAREVTWNSNDGVAVHGWLFEPVGERSDDNPWPLLTFVHGGPGFAFSDEFAFYFKSFGGIWPYPFEVYALDGIAVFIPNYRGTKTFGDEFGDPTRLDGESIDDIITGIQHLIGEGIADPERLAISGQSHGAWLAPLVMTRTMQFRAASFAEGALNTIVNYNLMAGFLNRVTHDIINGSSLYDDPQRYIDLSPDLHFEGLDTAVMFEAGAKSLAISMMGAPKAAQRAGMPTEFVVYPKTGHNIQLPSLQKESAERNLDWFRFWLLGEDDLDPAKAEQYERWRKLRSVQEKNN